MIMNKFKNPCWVGGGGGCQKGQKDLMDVRPQNGRPHRHSLNRGN